MIVIYKELLLELEILMELIRVRERDSTIRLSEEAQLGLEMKKVSMIILSKLTILIKNRYF